MTAGDDSVGVRTAMIGDHHVSNCLAAATTGLAYGIDLTTIARGLEAVDCLPGRMQRVMCGQDCSVFVDAARSPDALRACLRAARQATAGRLICVFGPPGEDEPVERPLLGRVAGAMADLAIITSACPFGDVRPAVLADVRRGFAAPHTALLVPHRENAIRAALAEARTGDSVVVAGMGDLEYRPTHDDDTLWNDFHVIRHVLLSSPGAAARPRLAA
jgi:UDP-N-acetylmuramoyl-L-alanyl-D-glutamate--2,6-diaminopimelate ligase